MSRKIEVADSSQLQEFLFNQFPDTKKIKVKQWLKFGSVLVNGKRQVRYDHELAAGDEVEIKSVTEARAASLLPRGLKVVYEDSELLVIDKPPNLLSIASEAEKDKTAYAIMTNYVRGGNERGSARVWVVHRLDQETSGLMVFARNEETKITLQDNWEEAEKRYFAVVEGQPENDEGTLRSFLDERNPHHVKSVAESEHTRHAISHYTVLKRVDKFALVELTLGTGRRHQIRVQLKEIGCPVIGDEKYGAKTNTAGRLGLHSCYLRLPHPASGEMVEFTSALPTSLAKVVGD